MENSDKNQEQKIKESEAPKEKKRTWGNVLYDFGVFGSVAWVGVAVLSALSAHESKYGKNKMFGWLRSLNDHAYSGLKKCFGSTILKGAKPETIDGYAQGTTMFLTLGMGGNALMGIIKWLEDHRQRNAAVIDNFLGTTPPNPETIAKEPHQTWKSVLTGRMLSWGGSYAAFLAMGPKLTDTLSKGAGEWVANQWCKWKPEHNPTKVRRWADIAAFDALFTLITASATYAISRFVARKDETKSHDIEEALYEAQVAAPTVFEPVFRKKYAEKIRSERQESMPLSMSI